jgi:hypothetical protein
MKQPVTARTMNYELDLLRGVLKYAGCWTPELETEYPPLPELKSKVGKAATVQQLAKIIKGAAWARIPERGGSVPPRSKARALAYLQRTPGHSSMLLAVPSGRIENVLSITDMTRHFESGWRP